MTKITKINNLHVHNRPGKSIIKNSKIKWYQDIYLVVNVESNYIEIESEPIIKAPTGLNPKFGLTKIESTILNKYLNNINNCDGEIRQSKKDAEIDQLFDENEDKILEIVINTVNNN